MPSYCSCFTTEILEGFDVQRTAGFADTVRKYGYLTKSIAQYYSTYFFSDKSGTSVVCPTFSDFVKKCQNLEKMTVTDVFAVQLMQVITLSLVLLNSSEFIAFGNLELSCCLNFLLCCIRLLKLIDDLFRFI